MFLKYFKKSVSFKKISVVVRSFQEGASFVSFNKEKYEAGVARPLRTLLQTAPLEIDTIIVLSCGDKNSPFAEEIVDGITPTMYHLRQSFPNETASGKLITVLCTNWGPTRGSATALNLGIDIAREQNADAVLFWSPELALSGDMVTEMCTHMERHELELCGYLREGWQQKLQWALPQNTCALWSIDLLNSIGGMNHECNGDGITTVSTDEYGEVLLAGMEDIDAYFRASLQHREFLRWGCCGKNTPAHWDTSLKVPGTPEYEDHIKKIARQALVMDAYARKYFPHMSPNEVYTEMMKVGTLE